MRPPNIYIDFVPGAHGHYLEYVCNTGFGFTNSKNLFTASGTSHLIPENYIDKRAFIANHWYQIRKDLSNSTVISIRFTEEDLLLMSSVSLLRSGDYKIDNNNLENNTRLVLKNTHYAYLVNEIQSSYPFLDESNNSIPRYVLREFFKFGYKDPKVHGLMIEQSKMVYPASAKVLNFNFSDFYCATRFESALIVLGKSLGKPFTKFSRFLDEHQQFLSHIPYIKHKDQCDNIIKDVCNNVSSPIPPLALFQESYINGVLENKFKREMPFHQEKYFNSTEDVLYYINNIAKPL